MASSASALVILPAVIALCQLRTIGFMGASSLLGNAALLAAVVMVIAYSARKIEPHAPRSA